MSGGKGTIKQRVRGTGGGSYTPPPTTRDEDDGRERSNDPTGIKEKMDKKTGKQPSR